MCAAHPGTPRTVHGLPLVGYHRLAKPVPEHVKTWKMLQNGAADYVLRTVHSVSDFDDNSRHCHMSNARLLPTTGGNRTVAQKSVSCKSTYRLRGHLLLCFDEHGVGFHDYRFVQLSSRIPSPDTGR